MLMTAFRIATATACLVCFVFGAMTALAADAGGRERALPECVEWRKIVRYRNYGYDHIVEIHNACSQRAACVVKTDVNPEPIKVSVAPDESKEVLTFMGSPARVFEADVQCTLAR
jgi:hypothetical protein